MSAKKLCNLIKRNGVKGKQGIGKCEICRTIFIEGCWCRWYAYNWNKTI